MMEVLDKLDYDEEDLYRIINANKKVFRDNCLLTTDDVLLKPGYGVLSSRDDVRCLKRYIYTAPMDKVTDINMYWRAISQTDVVIPVLARQYLKDFYKVLDVQLKYLDRDYERSNTIQFINDGFISIGTTDEDIAQIQGILHLIRITSLPVALNICVDIAHGYSTRGMETIKKLLDLDHDISIMCGSIVTVEAAESMVKAGVSHLRIGIGGGSMCSTRLMTHIGKPTLSAIWDIWSLIHDDCNLYDVQLIADGGIQNPGQIAAYLSAGATGVMIGSAFAACSDSPAETTEDGFKIQRGQASKEFQLEHYGKVRNDCEEGVTRKMPVDIPFLDKVSWFHGGVKSSVSYLGLESIQNLDPYYVEFRRVSSSTVNENHPMRER